MIKYVNISDQNMKDLLYLKDDQIKEFIQLLYYAYRETFSDPKEILSRKFFGPAHLRALHLIESNPGINLGELIFKLKGIEYAKLIMSLSKKGTLVSRLTDIEALSTLHRLSSCKYP